MGIINHNYLPNQSCASFPTNITCGDNNIFGGSALFVDSLNGDFRLQSCSPLINAGTNAAVADLPTDAFGQPRIRGGTVDIGPYEAPPFGLAATPIVKPACAGASDGSVSYALQDGCEPYTLAWAGGTASGTAPLDNLSPGTYAFTLTDAAGHSLLDTVVIAENPPIVVQAAAQNLVCGTLGGGSVSASAAGGTPPLDFLWSNGSTGSQLAGLLPGVYALTVSDALDCRQSATAEVLREGLLTILADFDPISCFGANDGALAVQPLSGLAPFVFQWSQGDSTAQVENLPPGDYAVTVLDQWGCTATFSRAIAEPGLLLADLDSVRASGPTNADGAVSVAGVSGGTQPYRFLWNTGDTTAVVTGLPPGTYSLTLTDAQGCTFVGDVVVDFYVGASDARPETGLAVFPNPVADRLFVRTAEGIVPRGISASVLDALGREVLALQSSQSNALVFDVSRLAAGNYILQLCQADGTAACRQWLFVKS